MISLKRFFKPDPFVLPTTKTEKEILKCFLAAKKDFDHWLQLNPQPKIRFQFYFPTAIDFYFDDFKLFTAYFKKGQDGAQELVNLKISNTNYSSIRIFSWKPFEEVMVNFLNTLDETNKAALFQKTRSLHEYASLCEAGQAKEGHSQYSTTISSSMAAG